MDLMALVARLTLDKSNYDQGLDDASKGAQSFGDKLKNGLGTAAKVGAAAVTAVAAAAGAMTTALVKGAGDVAAYGDNIDKASQKLGISAEAYQEWDAVLQHSGTSIDSMGIGMKTLANAAAGGSEAFKRLGISQKAAASMSREDLFSQTITALQNVRDENERAQLAQELFGRSAMELGPLLNTSAKDTKAMKDRVHELGGVLSNESVKAAAAYQDSLQDMTTAMDGMRHNLFAQFLPGLTTVMDGVTDLFAGGKNTRKIQEGAQKFIKAFTTQIPKFAAMGARIAGSVGDAIISALPDLAGQIIQGIPGMLNSLLDYVRGRLIPDVATLIGDILDVPKSSGFTNRLKTTLRQLLNDVTGVISAIGDAVGLYWNNLILPVLTAVVTFITTKVLPSIHTILENLIPMWENVAPIIERVFNVIVGIWRDIIIPVFEDVRRIIVENVIPIVVAALGTLIEVAGEVFNGIADFWEDTLKPAFESLYSYVVKTLIPTLIEFWKKRLQPAIEGVFKAIAGFWTNTLKPALEAIYSYVVETLIPTLIDWWENHLKPSVEGVFTAIAGFWNTTLKPAFEAIRDFVVKTLLPKFKEFGGYVGGKFLEAFKGLKTYWQKDLEPRVKALKEALNTFYKNVIQPIATFVSGAFSDAWKKVTDFFKGDGKQAVSGVSGAFETLFNTWIKPVTEWVGGAFSTAWETAQGMLNGFIDFLTGVFSGNWKKAWDGLVDMAAAPFKGLKTILKTPINGVIDLLNKMLDKVEGAINKVIRGINNHLSFRIPDWVPGYGGKQWGVNMKTVSWGRIKELAKGGTLDEGETAMVGEYAPEMLRVVNGRAIVTPLSNVPGRLGGDTITNTFNIYAQPGQDVEAIARAVQQQLTIWERQRKAAYV